MQPAQPAPKAPSLKQFKGQPWVLYDTVSAHSFLCGDTSPDGLAIGSRNPAISAKGEMAFFQERTRKGVGEPYTNLDMAGQLSYGMEVWGIYLMVMMPVFRTGNFPQPIKLAETLLSGGAVLVDLGQEEQSAFHAYRFGAGGGLVVQGFDTQSVNNGWQERKNVLAFPEPIEMPRTQNFGVTLELSAEAIALIGDVAAPGLGIPLPGISFVTTPFGAPSPITINKRQLGFMVQLGFIGRRVKRTQYGQLAGGSRKAKRR